MQPLVRLYILFAVLATVYACGNKTATKKFSEKRLKGNWIISYAAASDHKGEELEVPNRRAKGEEEAPRNDYELLTIYSFNGAGGFQSDSGGHEYITGTISIQDTMVQLKATGARKAVSGYWSVLRSTDSSMTVLTDWPGAAQEKVVYDLVKLREDPGYNIAGITWKKPLDSAATSKQLRDRLHTQLVYYAGYFKTLSQNQVTVFAPHKVICPVSLYSGGLGTKPLSQCPLWVKNMGSQQNAEKAFDMLRAAFKKPLKYPETNDDYMLEYSIVLDHLAKQL